MQRLPIEPISQASANQRAGRCGRVADGICIRLYSEEDFESRPEFTEPEILRTNLASVILQMTVARARRHRALPVRRAAGLPPDHRRRPAARGAAARIDEPARPTPRKRLTAARPQARRAAGRPAARRGWCSRPSATAALREVLVIVVGPVDPGPARAAAGQAAAGATSCTRRFADEHSRLRRAAQPLALPQGAAAGAVGQRVPPDVQGRVPALPARSASGRTCTASSRAACQDRSACSSTLATQADADRDPPVAARRAALAHRAARRRASASTSAPAAPGSASRPGSALFKKQPQLGDGGRAGRDHPALGPRQRPHRPGVGRAAGRAPRQAQLQRAALGASAGRRGGLREGHALRRPARRRPHGQLRPGRPRGVAGAVHPARPRRGRLGHPPPVLPRQPRAARASSSELEHRARRRDILVDDETLFDVLRRAAARRRRVRARTSTRWWKKAQPRAARPADVHRGPARQRRRRRASAPRTTRTSGSRARSSCR